MMAINACKPGKTLIEIHNVAVKYITKGLIEAKILNGSIQRNIRDETYKKYYMHNTGHWLGLDVHDPSSYSIDGEANHTQTRYDLHCRTRYIHQE